MKRLHRYLAGEIVRPLLAALLLLFQLLFALQLLRGTDLVFGAGATAADVGRIALDLAPHFVAMAIPIAFLLGTLIGLGRLAEDRELLALGASGVDPFVLLPVPLLLAGALSVIGLWLGRSVEPHGLAHVRDAAGEMLRRNLQGEVKSGKFFGDLTGLTLYAEDVDPVTHAWTHVIVHDDRDRTAPMLVLAQRGRLDAAPGSAVALELGQGEVHRGAEQQGDEYSLLRFEHGRIEVGLDESFFRHSAFRADTQELTLDELRDAARTAPIVEKARELNTAVARRFATPLAPLALALLAVPLATRLRRAARSRGFALAAAAFAAYYVLSRIGQQWGDAGRFPPLLAAQLPNVAFAIVGVLLIARARARA